VSDRHELQRQVFLATLLVSAKLKGALVLS